MPDQTIIGDPRPAGDDGPAGDPRHGGQATIEPAFDPADHTVGEVHDYLADADEREHARVLDLERTGKNRTSIVG